MTYLHQITLGDNRASKTVHNNQYYSLAGELMDWASSSNCYHIHTWLQVIYSNVNILHLWKGQLQQWGPKAPQMMSVCLRKVAEQGSDVAHLNPHFTWVALRVVKCKWLKRKQSRSLWYHNIVRHLFGHKHQNLMSLRCLSPPPWVTLTLQLNLPTAITVVIRKPATRPHSVNARCSSFTSSRQTHLLSQWALVRERSG